MVKGNLARMPIILNNSANLEESRINELLMDYDKYEIFVKDKNGELHRVSSDGTGTSEEIKTILQGLEDNKANKSDVEASEEIINNAITTLRTDKADLIFVENNYVTNGKFEELDYKDLNITVPSSGWILNEETKMYVNDILVEGLLGNYDPVYVLLGKEFNITEKELEAYESIYEMKIIDGHIILYSEYIITETINLGLKNLKSGYNIKTLTDIDSKEVTFEDYNNLSYAEKMSGKVFFVTDRNRVEDKDKLDDFASLYELLGFNNRETIFNEDGSIEEIYDFGKKVTTFTNGDMVEYLILNDGTTKMSKSITFNEDGTITEVII